MPPHENKKTSQSHPNAGRFSEESRIIAQPEVASALFPDSLIDLLQAGIEFQRRGHFSQAMDLYQQVLDINPGNADAWHLLGVVAHQKSDYQTAIDLIGRAIAIAPDVATYHLNFGSAKLMSEKSEDLESAIEAFETAIKLDSRLAMAHNNLANAFRKKGSIEKVLDHLETALSIDPDYSQAYCNRGATLIELGDLEQAEISIRRALALEPESSEARCNLALIEARLGKAAEAIEHYQQALQRQPNLQVGWNNLGQLLAEQGLVDGARTAFQQVFRLSSKPYHQFRAASVCPVIPQSVLEIDAYRDSLIKQLDALLPGSTLLANGEYETSLLQPPFYLPYHGGNDLGLKTKWDRMLNGPISEIDSESFERNRNNLPAQIGFVVADRHVPVFWKFVGGFLQRLPCNDLKIAVFGNQNSIRELKRLPIPSAVSLHPFPNRIDGAVATIRDLKVDAVFHFEPEADCFGYFLARKKIAPIQLTSWGIPVTSGIEAMTDYISCELIETPDSDQHYCENLIRFKRLPVYFHRPAPVVLRSKEWFGFKNSDQLYGCPHSLFKLHPNFDRVLAEIVRRDRRAKIVLVEGRHSIWTSLLKQRWEKSIPDVVQRMHFLPAQSQSDFRSLLEVCDVLLDPFPFGGGATTYEVMSVGKPTVTCPGEFMRGRVTYGCWKQMGILDCVAKDEEDYISKAVEIASNADLRSVLKQRISDSEREIFEDDAAVVEMRDWLLKRIHDSRNH